VPDDREPGAQGLQRLKRALGRPLHWFNTSSLIATLLGGLLGIAGTLLTLWYQSRADVHVRASVSATDIAVQGIAVRATFTNDGLSGATVRDVALLVDDQQVAMAKGTLADPGQLHGSLPYQADVGSKMGPPTIAVGSRSTLTVAIVFNVPTKCTGGTAGASKVAKEFACLVINCKRTSCPGRGRVKLRLTTSQGKGPDAPVRVDVPTESFISWQPLVHQVRGAPPSLGLIRHGPGAQVATEMVQLRLWRLDRPESLIVADRPVIGRARTWFPLEGVRPGRYTWVVSSGQKTLVAGFLKVCERACEDPLYGMRGRIWRDGRRTAVPVSAPPSPEVAPPPPPPTACADEIDNDGDGLVDAADSGCIAPDSESEAEVCSDGVDQDADGLVDLRDPGCDSPADGDELDPPAPAPTPTTG
jgi:hypothetical protein